MGTTYNSLVPITYTYTVEGNQLTLYAEGKDEQSHFRVNTSSFQLRRRQSLEGVINHEQYEKVPYGCFLLALLLVSGCGQNNRNNNSN